jgi:hypothetical protein
MMGEAIGVGWKNFIGEKFQAATYEILCKTPPNISQQ